MLGLTFLLAAVVLGPRLADASAFGTLPALELQDSKEKVESVGAPMGTQWKQAGDKNLYARNIWDLQAFNGRLYTGYGDMSLNSGHMAITSYDPQLNTFIREYETTDQGVYRYRIFGDQLMATGIDPDGEACSIFFRGKEGWKEVHTPDAKHAFDAYLTGGKLFVSLHHGGGCVGESPDDGKTWPHVYGPLDPIRTFSLFELGGQLYVSTFDGSVYRYTGKGFVRATGFRTKVPPKELPVGRDWGNSFVIHKPVNLSRDQLYYVGWNIRIDFQAQLSHWNGYGLFLAVSQGGSVVTQPVALRGLPEDVIVVDGVVYAVANEDSVAKEEKSYTVRVYAVKGMAVKELLSFKSEALARSIEILNGSLYIGLGCLREALSTKAGEILRWELKSTRK